MAPLFAGIGPAGLALVAALAGLGEEALFRGVVQPGSPDRCRPGRRSRSPDSLSGCRILSHLAYAVLAALVGAYLGWLHLLPATCWCPSSPTPVYDLVALLVLLRMKPTLQPSSSPDTFRGHPASFHRAFRRTA